MINIHKHSRERDFQIRNDKRSDTMATTQQTSKEKSNFASPFGFG